MPKKTYVVGTSKLIEKLKAMPADVTKGVKKAVAASGVLVQTTAVHSIMEGGGAGKNHIASRPGEPPNADTGQLHNSIYVEITDEGLGCVVGSNLEKAKHLEFGTLHMEPRPFLLPALKKNQKGIVGLIGREVAKALMDGRTK